MKFFPASCFLTAFCLIFVRLTANGATDPEIDRLLKKLPAPEKLVKPDERFPHVNDPALRDPLVKQMDSAIKKRQGKRALGLARQLATRYPSSALAHCYAGYLAADDRRLGEASTEFRRALAIQPKFVFAHYCLGYVECQQGHFSVALHHLREVTKLEPGAVAGWALLSTCAEIAGDGQQSVAAARKLVTLAPGQSAAWIRLAIAEKNVGNRNASAQALNRAVAIQRAAGQKGQRKKSVRAKNDR